MLKEFETHETSISYSYGSKNDIFCPWVFEDEIKDNSICLIESVYVTEEFQGIGFGTKAMKEFIHFQKEKGIKHFYLFAAYNNDDFRTPDGGSGLSRLIKFYEKFGFQSESQPISVLNSDQIDMYLSLS